MADDAHDPALAARLRAIVGRRHVLTHGWATRPYRAAYRMQVGAVAVVVRPATLVELWHVLEACVAARCAIIMQAANTGLTGGSTPAPGDYDRPVIVVSVLRIRAIHLIEEGTQAICFAGSTLDTLERRLRPIGRAPHSVIGSSCLGASVTGGICNNSGGALVQRGPAYTELALFAQVDAQHRLHLVNHLGVNLGDTPEEILRRLDRGAFTPADVAPGGDAAASDRDYRDRVRDLSSSTPARFNADVRRLHEAAGSAGKVAVFAVRVDTFPAPAGDTTFYIGTNMPDRLSELRRSALTGPGGLPVSAEYLHRDAFDIAQSHGRDIYLAVRLLATRHLTALFRIRKVVEGLAERWLGRHSAMLHAGLHAALRHSPSRFPDRLLAWRDRYIHHLILKVEQEHAAEYRRLLEEQSAAGDFAFFACTPDEAKAAFSHRFAIAGAANNLRLADRATVGDLVTLDVALPPSEPRWHDFLPEALHRRVLPPIAYGHFFCHVFHFDYLVCANEDAKEVRTILKHWLDKRGALYPAEHNFGHLYEAPPEVAAHYRALDPTNTFNPGIGGTSRKPNWVAEHPPAEAIPS